MVGLGSKQKDGNLFAAGFSKFSIQIWKLHGSLFGGNGLKVRVWYHFVGDEHGVDESDGQESQSWCNDVET